VSNNIHGALLIIQSYVLVDSVKQVRNIEIRLKSNHCSFEHFLFTVNGRILLTI